jgi:hypothetical protein
MLIRMIAIERMVRQRGFVMATSVASLGTAVSPVLHKNLVSATMSRGSSYACTR